MHGSWLRTLSALTAATWLLSASTAAATPEAQAKIPPNDFGCTACHASGDATPETVPAAAASSLTSFGEDWLQLANDEARRLWSEMADMNSDDDGCSNGCELGDPDGEYLPDANGEFDACAPGDPNVEDCALPINEGSWSTLKSLFGERN